MNIEAHKPPRKSRQAWFRDVLATYKRIAVTGPANSGKTTLCRLAKDRPVISTDKFRQYDWGSIPHEVIKFVNQNHNVKGFVLEGVQVPRTLRKNLEVDAVVYLAESLEPQSKGQAAQAKGILTVLAEWRATHKDVPILQAPKVAATDENE